MLTAYYTGGDTANVLWQASQIAGGAHHFGLTATQDGQMQHNKVRKKLNHKIALHLFLWQKKACDEKEDL